MEVTEFSCSECGASDWNEVLSTDYPERRRERDRTVETVYDCESCGAQAKYFEYNNGDGSDTLSGAFA